ncbi:MAG: hypothetical protein Q8O67_16935 [Deltaproteobacteria bacterium]|nr:hypothetical protein [Deltaproteobacteria bacterium]
MPVTPTRAPLASSPASEDRGDGSSGGALSDLKTVPDTSARRLLDEARDELARVDDVVLDARASVPGWDNLGYVRAFCRAAENAKPLLSTTTNPLLRRLMAKALLRLIPPALLPAPWSTVTTGPTTVLHLDDAVLLRADDQFTLRSDDAPRIHPSWSAFLAHPGLIEGLLQPRRHEHLLAPRSLSPGAESTGSAVVVRVEALRAREAATHGAPAPEGVAVRVVSSSGASSSHRLTSDGKDAGEAVVKLEVLRAWLENAGPGARALDLRKVDDRALLVAFLATLRTRRLDVLLAKEMDPARRADVVDAVVDAAADTVAQACLDPLACRFCLPDEEWGREAARLLVASGLVVEVWPRWQGPHAGGDGPAPALPNFVWLDAVADAGLVGGSLSAVGQARSFARLAVSLLAPLGALPMVGARDGNGVVVTVVGEDVDGQPLQRGPWWVEPGHPEQPVTPLLQAWSEGRGRHLPEPKGGFAHDIRALPEWLGHFVQRAFVGDAT